MITVKKEKEQNLLQRLFGLNPKENAIIEINNLLAAKPVLSVTVEQVQAIAENYGVNLRQEFPTQRQEIYHLYLLTCFEDKVLTDEEIRELVHLKKLLRLNDDDIRKLTDRMAMEIYQKEVEKVMEDGVVDADEKAFLSRLRKDLRLSDDLAEKVYKESATEILQRFLTGFLVDERLDPDEEAELDAISRNFGVELTLDDKTKGELSRFKLFWQIDNGNFPQVKAAFKLHSDEVCHFAEKADLFEPRGPIDIWNKNRPKMRIRIAHGFYWKPESGISKGLSADGWRLLDRGTIFVTNRRVIFLGSEGNHTIRLSEILDFQVFDDGVQLQRETGRSPFMGFDRNGDLFAMLLGKLVSEC